jgi:competence protein ComEA
MKGGIMKGLRIKGVVFSVMVGFLLFCFLGLHAQSAPKASGKKININTASVGELQKIPRIGPKVAQRIIEFRKEHGKFKRIEEIMKVKGIGERTFERIKDFITVGEKLK